MLALYKPHPLVVTVHSRNGTGRTAITSKELEPGSKHILRLQPSKEPFRPYFNSRERNFSQRRRHKQNQATTPKIVDSIQIAGDTVTFLLEGVKTWFKKTHSPSTGIKGAIRALFGTLNIDFQLSTRQLPTAMRYKLLGLAWKEAEQPTKGKSLDAAFC
eukprot:jgi/Psemu1/48253/gm1.48253_g